MDKTEKEILDLLLQNSRYLDSEIASMLQIDEAQVSKSIKSMNLTAVLFDVLRQLLMKI